MDTYQAAFDHLKYITGQDNLRTADGIRILNFGVNDYSGIAMEVDGRWKFDDTRNTDKPTGYTAIVSGRSTYVLDRSFLKIEQVHIKVDGKWRVLAQTDRREYRDVPADQVHNTPGTPREYDFDGQTLSLFPAPNWSDGGDLTDTDNLSLRVLYKRPAVLITSLDQAIGIPSTHLYYLVLHGARQLGFRTIDNNRTDVRDELVKWEGSEIDGRMVGGKIRAFFSSRDEDRPRRIKPKVDQTFMRRRNI